LQTLKNTTTTSAVTCSSKNEGQAYSMPIKWTSAARDAWYLSSGTFLGKRWLPSFLPWKQESISGLSNKYTKEEQKDYDSYSFMTRKLLQLLEDVDLSNIIAIKAECTEHCVYTFTKLASLPIWRYHCAGVNVKMTIRKVQHDHNYTACKSDCPTLSCCCLQNATKREYLKLGKYFCMNSVLTYI
jgi:hypothetical protein